MKIVRSIQGIVSLGRLKSESVERERNVDFMLNNNPGGIESKKEVRCTTGGPIQRKVTRRLGKETELTEFSDYPKRPKSKVTNIFSFNVGTTKGTR